MTHKTHHPTPGPTNSPGLRCLRTSPISTRYTVRVETLLTPAPSTKPESLLDTQTTPYAASFLYFRGSELQLRHKDGHLATSFLQSLHFVNRLRANSRRFRDIAKINRYKIPLCLLHPILATRHSSLATSKKRCMNRNRPNSLKTNIGGEV